MKRKKGTDQRWEADLNEEFRTPIANWEYRTVQPYKGRYWAISKDNLMQFARDGLLIHRETGMPRLIHYADEMPGVSLQDLWEDIPPVIGREDLGYSTQKPLSLLERIVNASSKEGEVVLDPFCGCGTAIAAAQELKRKWIGIDITHLAIALQKNRLKDMFGLLPGRDYQIVGEPEDLGGAEQLAHDNRYQFQWWALSLIQARPLGGQEGSKTWKKGSDKGIDGVITFIDDATSKPKRALVQVKSGHVKSGDIRDLIGTVNAENAALGIFVTLEEPTRDMITAAAKAGVYHSPGFGRDYSKIQILTIEDLLKRPKVEMPPAWGTFKQAEKVEQEAGKQVEMDLE